MCSEPVAHADTPSLRLASEYADVRVSLVRTGAGKRVRLESLRTGDRTELDATVLEVLTTLDQRSIATLVEAYAEHGTITPAIGGGTGT